jgi:hypothetical protein
MLVGPVEPYVRGTPHYPSGSYGCRVPPGERSSALKVNPGEEVRRVSPGLRREPDREQVLDRLRKAHARVPVRARELAGARRQAARGRLENSSLVEQVRKLQRRRIRRAGNPAGELAMGATSDKKGVGDAEHTHPVARLG